MTRRQILTCSIAMLCMLFGVERVVAQYSIPTDTSIGIWDNVSRTYTLTTDVSASIQIDEDNLTLNGDGYTVYGSGSGEGVYVTWKRGVAIENVNIHGFEYGILIEYSEDFTITGNTASDSYFQIYIRESSHCTLTGNTVSDGGYGIFVYGSEDCTVASNTVSNNYVGGILVSRSDSCTITGNTVSNNLGIHVGESSHCTLTGNTVSARDQEIFIYRSEDCTITGNTFSDKVVGIRISVSTVCQIYNNNFICDTFQCYVYVSTCVFYLPAPVGGNYWNNWNSPDNDNDGFVDIPFVFEGGQDNLPWTVQDGWLTPPKLVGQIIDLTESLNLENGIEKSLLVKLETTLKILEDANEINDVAAINSLEAFINAVGAQLGKKIPEEDANALIDATLDIIERLTTE